MTVSYKESGLKTKKDFLMRRRVFWHLIKALSMKKKDKQAIVNT